MLAAAEKKKDRQKSPAPGGSLANSPQKKRSHSLNFSTVKKSTGTAPSGKKDAPTRSKFLKGKCEDANCQYHHVPTCKFFKKTFCIKQDR